MEGNRIGTKSNHLKKLNSHIPKPASLSWIPKFTKIKTEYYALLSTENQMIPTTSYTMIHYTQNH